MSWLTPSGILALLSGPWGYALLFPLSVVEGPMVSIFAGLLVALGEMNWLLVFLILFAGDLVGDIGHYYIGRWGHGPWAERFASRMGVTPERLARFNKAFLEHGVKVLLINKTQFIGSVPLYYAGAVRMPLWTFTWANAVGTAPKVALFLVVGYYFGESYERLEGYLNYAAAGTLIIPVGLLALYWLFKRYGAQEQKEEHLI